MPWLPASLLRGYVVGRLVTLGAGRAVTISAFRFRQKRGSDVTDLFPQVIEPKVQRYDN